MGSRPTEVGYTKNDPEDHDQVKAGRNNMTTQRADTEVTVRSSQRKLSPTRTPKQRDGYGDYKDERPLKHK